MHYHTHKQKKNKNYIDPVLLSLIHGNKISLVAIRTYHELLTGILDVYHTFNYGVNNCKFESSVGPYYLLLSG